MKYNHPRFLFRRFEVLKNVTQKGHFLEIGPGNLSLALDLLNIFSRCTLVDFNTTDVVDIFNGLGKDQKERIELIIADFSLYDQFNHDFDCIVSCEVMEHIEDDKAFLRKIFKLLVPNGQLILSVPARQKFWAKDDEIVGHFRRYEKSDLFEKLSEAGFSKIKITSYGYPFINIIRLGRLALTKFQYNEKSIWDRKKQSQQSAFIIKRNPKLDWIAIIFNKYTLYPFNLLASLFNNLDFSEGYIVTGIKPTADVEK